MDKDIVQAKAGNNKLVFPVEAKRRRCLREAQIQTHVLTKHWWTTHLLESIKQEEWIEITDVVTQWKSRALGNWFKSANWDTTSHVENMVEFVCVTVLCSSCSVSYC